MAQQQSAMATAITVALKNDDEAAAIKQARAIAAERLGGADVHLVKAERGGTADSPTLAMAWRRLIVEDAQPPAAKVAAAAAPAPAEPEQAPPEAVTAAPPENPPSTCDDTEFTRKWIKPLLRPDQAAMRAAAETKPKSRKKPNAA